VREEKNASAFFDLLNFTRAERGEESEGFFASLFIVGILINPSKSEGFFAFFTLRNS
jgi:hypothetical protein